MAEQGQQNTQNQAANNKPKIYTIDKGSKLAVSIDELFFKWFDDRTYDLRNNDDEQIDTSKSLDILTKLVRALQANLRGSTDKAEVEFNSRFSDYLASGNADDATNILQDRPKEDHISKLMWLITTITTVSVLSGKLAETGKPLTSGPLSNIKPSTSNIDVIVPPIANSRQMRNPRKFLGEILPNTFAAIAKHKNLARAAANRAAITGKQYHNVETMDSMYKKLGTALVYVSTAFFAEANRAFTETGKRLAADKIKNFDFSRLSAEKQDKMMQTLRAAFNTYTNLTASANTFSSINDKLMLDAAYAAWYNDMNDQEKKSCGFVEDDFSNLSKVRAFIKKYRSLYERHYIRYSNLFVDGMMEALKKEQETVNKDWFENAITGEREFRRGRLAGRGNKFMHTGPMKWLDKKLSEKKKASLWIFPKLAFGTLKILTNPTLHKARKKLTGALFAGIRSFAQGVHSSFTKTGMSTEITYDEVMAKLKDATAKFNDLKKDKSVITNESFRLNEDASENVDSDEETLITKLKSALDLCNSCKTAFNKAMSDESIDKTKKAYIKQFSKVKRYAESTDLLNMLEDVMTNPSYSDSSEVMTLAKNLKKSYEECLSNFDEYSAKNKADAAGDAQDYKSTGNTLRVSEQAVKICEDVFSTLNRYVARQWNLLAAHSEAADMPLCAKYVWIDLPDFIQKAVNSKNNSRPTANESLSINAFTDNLLVEASDDDVSDDRRAGQAYIDAQHRHDDFNSVKDDTPENDKAKRDRRAQLHGNNGNHTAKYPIKYGNVYRYHGIALVSSSEDKNKTGFGVFADRLSKIAKPVRDFCTLVETIGDETTQKTFNNDKKQHEEPSVLGNIQNSVSSMKGKFANSRLGRKLGLQHNTAGDPTVESTHITDKELEQINEDIGNYVLGKIDPAVDKVRRRG
nr:MAG TPA_asm: hypothetical protein [Caudoviricetes sp.]